MAMDPEATASSNPDATMLQTASSGSGASGSGATMEQKRIEVDAKSKLETHTCRPGRRCGSSNERISDDYGGGAAITERTKEERRRECR